MQTTRTIRTLVHLVILALLTLTPAAERPTVAAPYVQPDWGRMPLLFIANQGQMDEQVAFYVQGRDKTLYFTPEGVTFALTDLTHQPAPQGEREARDSPFRNRPALQAGDEGAGERAERWIVKLDFVGANAVRPGGQEQADTVISYFTGPREEWYTGLPTYARIVYPELWAGIDLAYSGTANRLKYEFVVQPGADPARIRLAYRGATVGLNAAGQLEVSTPAGGFQDDAPIAYQEVNGRRVPVEVAYALEDAATYGFRLGAYDPAVPLVIDPAVLVYCGYIGGSDNDWGFGIAVDAAGSAYVTGYTGSTETTFPETVGPDLDYNGGDYDAFVAKVKADGTGLDYCGYIGGSGNDRGNGIAVDAAGSAYVTGETYSTEGTFPETGGPDLDYNGSYDAFVAKVKVDGMGLDYCGYIGGSSYDYGYGIAVDGDGSAYVTGHTGSTEATFPVTGGPDLTHNGNYDAFVAKVKADGTGLDYCGYIGGNDSDGGYGIAVDAAGSAYVTGETWSTEAIFPVTGGPDLTYGGDVDAFVAKVKADGTGLDYCGYIGGSGDDRGWGIAVDAAGSAYVTGYTVSTGSTFPETGGPDLDYNGSHDAFVAKVKADGTGLDYCGYIGGSGSDWGRGIAVDGDGSAYVTGYTRSTEATFPVTGGPDLTYNGSGDAFVAKVKADGTALVYCGYIGGNDFDRGLGIAVDAAGNAYVTGYIQSAEATFPVTGGPDPTYNGAGDAFAAKVSYYRESSTTAIVSSLNPSAYGESVIFTATVFGDVDTPSGTVQFKVDGANLGAPVPLSGGTASISTAALAAGTRTVTAEYGGDANYIGSTGTLSGGQVVNKVATTTGVTSSLNPSVVGQSVTFTATVSAAGGTPTGAVQFKVDGANLGAPVPLSGGTASISTAVLAAGTYTVTAEYGGDANYIGSTGTLSGGQVVNVKVYLPLVLRQYP